MRFACALEGTNTPEGGGTDMSESDTHGYWWLIIVIGCGAAVAGLVIGDALLTPAQMFPVFLVAFGVVAVTFLWVYALDRERFWWAVIPGLSAVTLMAMGATDWIVGKGDSYDYINIAVMGVGTAVIGLVLKRLDAKMTLYVIAAFAFGISILMSPLALVAVEIAVSAFLIYRVNQGRPMDSTHGWLHPQP